MLDARPGRLQDAELFAPPTRILKTYTEALVGLGHGHQPGSFNTLLSQGCVLENNSRCGNGGQKYIPRTEEGVGSLRSPGVQLLGQPAVIDDLSMTSPNKWLLNLVHDSVLKTITPISRASRSLTEEYTL